MKYQISYTFRDDQESPKINPEELEQVDVLEEKEHQIILYNDDVNTFEHVIDCLVKICEHTTIFKLNNVHISFIILESVLLKQVV